MKDLKTLKDRIRGGMGAYTRTYMMIFALIAIWLVFGVLRRITSGDWAYYNPRNISNLLRQMTVIGFLACGMVLVIVTGGIDLSVGSITGMVSVLVAYVQVRFLPKVLGGLGLSPLALEITIGVLTVLSALLVGLLAGAWQGGIIAYLNVPPFVVTLGGQLIFLGMILFITQGQSIGPMRPTVNFMGQGYLSKGGGLFVAAVVSALIFLSVFMGQRRQLKYGFPPKHPAALYAAPIFYSIILFGYIFIVNIYSGLQFPVFLLGVVAFCVTYLSNNTRFGRYVYAIGGNREATRLSGIDIKKNIFFVYSIMGLLAGVAGLVLAGYIGSGSSAAGRGYELDTIASCVIGGTSLAGGSGTIFGALVGAAVIQSILNGMSFLNLDAFWQYVVKGLVLILAVWADVAAKKREL